MRRKSSRKVLTSILVALSAVPGAIFGTAHAATPVPAPTVTTTSIDSGWTASATALAIRYNESIDISGTSTTAIAVTDGVGAAVPGTIAYIVDHGTVDDTALVWSATSPLLYVNGPYSVTFTAHAVNQQSTATDTVTTMAFTVDNTTPLTPASPDLTTSSGMPVAGPTDTVELSGTLSDVVGKGIGTSGISEVVLRLYSPTLYENDPGALFGGIASQGKTLGNLYISPAPASAGCSGTCPTSFSYDFKDLSLPPGVWGARVQAIDLAGNVSSQSDPTEFVVVSSPV